MHVIHGTWIPREPAGFHQDGGFYLWVESDRSVSHGRRVENTRLHPCHLSWATLGDFLAQKLHFRIEYGANLEQWMVSKTFLLPSASDKPVPSREILPYLQDDPPDEWELSAWQICCYPLTDVIRGLRDLHFIASQEADDFQLGADLMFWHHVARELRAVIAADQYIPSIAVRSLGPDGDSFELTGRWELLSDGFEATLRQYAACMPALCGAGSDLDDVTELFVAETLLRHFSECTLENAVLSTSTTAAFDRQIEGTLLDRCFHPSRSAEQEQALHEYQQWRNWRDRLGAGRSDAAFTLGFRLEEAPADAADSWQVYFVAISRADPSFKLDLVEYWTLTPAERVAYTPLLGTDFERRLLLSLGQAARVYARIWDGLETEHPAGFQLSLDEAYAFLKENAWVLEGAGFILMVPAWWTPEGRRRARVRLKTKSRVSHTGSNNGRSYFGQYSLIEYEYQLAVGDEIISEAEWERLLAAKVSLVQFRGEWMELDRDRLQRLLATWQERRHSQPEITVLDLLKAEAHEDDDYEWEHDLEIQKVLDALGEKRSLEPATQPPGFQGALRPYQEKGVAWLRYLESLGLNPCLADDMGLGKTVQVIAQLLTERAERLPDKPTLLIAPTSVLGNWRREIERFGPDLRSMIHQGPERQKDLARFRACCAQHDVVITSFALARLDEKLLRGTDWWRVVIDEAQNIKNPQSAQTRAIARLPARHRLALTGTPVENRLRDLWSIFNFLNPGYLGSEAQFRKAFELPIQRENDPARTTTLRRLVEPFILRRLKTDPTIIDDLPDKIEQKVYCNLTPEQASLYEIVVREVEGGLEEVEGIERRGLILATLSRLKQICNHPVHFLKDGSVFSGDRSQKLQRLTEMAEECLANNESLLVFTQFTEIGTELERFLRATLRCTTYFLHGGTPAARRDRMVAAFQEPESEPTIFILSVRAGGTGLTLTKANHVFHFDRWWNPAVEDQATDRAFRIGQTKNVFVHKFVAIGTIEERIDQMIEDKKQLAGSIIGSDEAWLTELDNETFKDLIALRQGAVVG